MVKEFIYSTPHSWKESPVSDRGEAVTEFSNVFRTLEFYASWILRNLNVNTHHITSHRRKYTDALATLILPSEYVQNKTTEYKHMNFVISETTWSLIAILMSNVVHIITCSRVRLCVLTPALKVDTTKNEFMPLQAEIGSSLKYHPKMSLAKCQPETEQFVTGLSEEVANFWTCARILLLLGWIKTSIRSV